MGPSDSSGGLKNSNSHGDPFLTHADRGTRDTLSVPYARHLRRNDRDVLKRRE